VKELYTFNNFMVIKVFSLITLRALRQFKHFIKTQTSREGMWSHSWFRFMFMHKQSNFV